MREIVHGDRELKASELTGNKKVFAIQKKGEAVHYRAAISGQRPQTEWWDIAVEAMNQRMQEGADRIFESLDHQRPTHP
jgi:hypothetical protein